jgi:uncharacterized protein YabN with tetrapyrrole methylase and pyrophosphatase domain
MLPGSLTVVGTGYRVAGHVTLEARAHMEQADKLLYLVGDPVMETWIRALNRSAESLVDCYAEGKPRKVSYQEMVARILAYVRRGLDVTVAFYGHPGMFADPPHAAVRLARKEGYRATLLPGISAEDCLFADLDLDPADKGWQSYEATDFLNRRPLFDPRCGLVLWQVGVIGEGSIAHTANREGLRELVHELRRHYARHHRVVVYEASSYPVCDPVIRRIPLGRIPQAEVSVSATLYVPPRREARRGG